MEDIIDIIVTETTNTIEITAQPNDEIIDVNIIDNREDITLNVTPTLVEVNINSLVGNFGINWGEITGTLSNQTDLNTALGLKADLVGGKVPSSQLPSYVDDVVEVANYASLPATGETGKIYITIDTNYIYRWTGSVYVEIKDSSAVWGAITGTLSNQTDLQNALNAKDAVLTFSSPLSRSTNTVSIPAATTSVNGYLTSTDWTTFNAKQAQLNGTGFVKASGTTISYDNTSYLPLTGGTLTGNLLGTNITISNSLIAKGGTFNGGASYGGIVTIDGLGSDLLMNRADTSNGTLITMLTNAGEMWSLGMRSVGNDNFYLYNIGLTANALTIAKSNSAATFASSVTASSLYVTGMTAGNGAIYHTGSRLTFANYNASGTLHFEVNGGTGALTLNADKSATFEAGGTFAGALSGTSATFSGNVDSSGRYGATSNQTSPTDGSAYFYKSSSGAVVSGYQFIAETGGAGSRGTRLTIDNTGAATFSSSVQATSIGVNTAPSYPLHILRATGSDYIAKFEHTSASVVTQGVLINTPNDTSDTSFLLNVQSASTSRFVVKGNGNVGIGTNSPNAVLEVAGTSANTDFRISRTVSSSTYFFIKAPGGTPSSSTMGINGTDVMTLNSSGYVGIGTTSPANTLDIQTSSGVGSSTATGLARFITAGTTTAISIGQSNSARRLDLGSQNIKMTGDDLYITNTSANATIFENNGSPSMRITSGGDVCIASTAPVSTRRELRIGGNAAGSRISLGLNGTNYSALVTDSGGNVYLTNEYNDSAIKLLIINYNNGVYLSQSATSWTSNSDERLKTDLVAIENATEKVASLRSVIGRYKTDDESKRRPFLIAQDVYSVLPEAVDIDQKTGMMGVQYTEVIPLLVASIKELKSKIETLENK